MRSKENSRLHPFLYFLLMTLFGLLLVFRSDLESGTIIRILGAACTVGGLISIIGYIRSTGGGDTYLRLFCGILVIAGGIYILVSPALMEGFFPAAMGIIIMLNGFLNLTRSLDYLKTRITGWRVPLIMSLITMAAGLGILLNPFPSPSMMLKVLGIIILYNAVTSLWIHTRRPRRAKRSQN